MSDMLDIVTTALGAVMMLPMLRIIRAATKTVSLLKRLEILCLDVF